ncbi:LOW QUALITY PROTEIN: hypothetical protein M8C21_019828, partial [Ambrosia artemisiifolia]
MSSNTSALRSSPKEFLGSILKQKFCWERGVMASSIKMVQNPNAILYMNQREAAEVDKIHMGKMLQTYKRFFLRLAIGKMCYSKECSCAGNNWPSGYYQTMRFIWVSRISSPSLISPPETRRSGQRHADLGLGRVVRRMVVEVGVKAAAMSLLIR